MASDITNSKLYEEHTNLDFQMSGNKKIQTFDLRLDNNNPHQRRPSRRKIWKIQNKTSAPVGKVDMNDTESENDESDDENEVPLTKVQKVNDLDLQMKSDLVPTKLFNIET